MADYVKLHESDVERHKFAGVAHQLSKYLLANHNLFPVWLVNKLAISCLFDTLFEIRPFGTMDRGMHYYPGPYSLGKSALSCTRHLGA